MIGQWISYINCALISLALLLSLGGGWLWLKRPAEIAYTRSLLETYGLPKGSFELPQQVYDKIGEPLLLVLQQASLTLQLPDLRQQLIYYGKNGRPDAKSDHVLLHFSLNGNKNITSISPSERLYLMYDRVTARYVFSPGNEKTSLWIEPTPVNNEVQMQVILENDQGEKIIEPEAYAQFRLPEKEFIRYAGTTWEIGSFRVDGTLLARQRARWYGCDRFLEHHGGEDYQEITGKQRIDFGENDDLYSVFVKMGDCLIWNQNRWKITDPGEESLKHPLLVVKKVDERLMIFELWDVEGKGKVALNLLKSIEPWPMPQTLQHIFKFVAAHTKTQCVFEVNRERMILKPSDWLLLTPKGWKKLATEEEIDQYVRRKLNGTLFVFEGVMRKNEQQVMKGMLYSPSRHDCQTIEIEVGGIKPSKDKKDEKENKDVKAIADLNKIPLIRENPLVPHPILPSVNKDK